MCQSIHPALRSGSEPHMKRICVYGVGAVGGHIAARLAHSGVDVSVVARGANLDAIRAKGLKLTSGDETFEGRVRASSDPHELGEQDAVIVTVKANSLASVAEGIAPLLGPDTPVVFAINGIPWWYQLELKGAPPEARSRLDPGGLLEGTVGLERTVACVIYSSNSVIAPGEIRNPPGGGKRFTLGEPSGGADSARCVALSALLTGAGMDAPITGSIRAEIWKKLLMNLSVSGVCCLTDSDMSKIAASAELRALCYSIIQEGRAIAAAHGAVVEATPEQMLPPALPAHKPSILQDLEHRKPMEVDAMFVAATDFARAAGVATPVLDAVVAMIRQRAATAGLYSLV